MKYNFINTGTVLLVHDSFYDVKFVCLSSLAYGVLQWYMAVVTLIKLSNDALQISCKELSH